MFTIAGAVLALALQAAPAPGGLGEAYHAFLQGRVFESRGDISGAVAAYKRSLGADAVPCSYEELEEAELVVLVDVLVDVLGQALG